MRTAARWVAALAACLSFATVAFAQRALGPAEAPPAAVPVEPAPAPSPNGARNAAELQAPPDAPEPPHEAEPERSSAGSEPPRTPGSARKPRMPCEDCLPGAGRRYVDTGAVRYTLERIELRGNTRTSSRVVLRYVPFQPGDVLDVDDPEVQASRYRLLGTGFFRDVQFSLKKGSERGLVVLVIDLAERNTIVINDIFMGFSTSADARGDAFAGIDVAETNLGGTGITLGSAIAVANHQLGLRVRFLDPAFMGGPWMTSGVLLFNNARDYFGNAEVLDSDPGNPDQNADYALVRYKRFGGSLGVGRDLGLTTQLWLNYRLEAIDASYPLQASHLRGFTREPIDFNVVRGRSVLSTLGATLQHDTRDHPFLPSLGWFIQLRSELSLLPASLNYDYQRIELDASRWWQLPWHRHVVKLGLYGGAIAGDAPFFEQFHVADFSDFRPDRALGINFDRRPSPNFLGTSIAEVRYGTYALRLGTEYRIPFYRGHRSIYGIDVFASGGIFAVAAPRDLTDPPGAYSGLARLPIDITANLGFRMDTSAGGFVFTFANVISFIPVQGEGPAGGQ